MTSSSSTADCTHARAGLKKVLALGERGVAVGDRFVLTAALTPAGLLLNWRTRDVREPLARFALSLEPRLRADVTVTLPDDDALHSRYEDNTFAQLGRGKHRDWLFVNGDGTDAFSEFWNAVVATGQAVEPRLRRRELRTARGLVDRCETWAISRVPAEAMSFAKGFRPDTCAWVIDELRHDASGRIKQALEVCPGLAQVGLLLQDAGREPLWRVAADEIVRGRKLNQVIDGLIEASRSGPGSFGDDATLRVRQAVRCAGPWVRRSCLKGRFPPGISWSDAPRQRGMNAAWFEVIDTARTTQDDRLGEAAVCAFTSAHGVPLSRALRRSPLGWDRFFLWCRSTRRFPNRRSDPTRLVREAVRWCRANDARSALAEAAKARLAADRAPFPPPPFPDVFDGAFTARAIRDARALQEHGVAMQHCVYNEHVERAVAGDDYIYDCACGDSRFTVAIRREAGEWLFVAASGVRNKVLTAEERTAVEGWLEANEASNVPGAESGRND